MYASYVEYYVIPCYLLLTTFILRGWAVGSCSYPLSKAAPSCDDSRSPPWLNLDMNSSLGFSASSASHATFRSCHQLIWLDVAPDAGVTSFAG